MKSFKEVIANTFSTKFVGIVLFLITTVFVTFILSSRYYLHDSVIENSISKRDVYANKTISIVDIERTSKLKGEIAKKISPIFVPIQDDFIKSNTEKNIEKIINIRAEHIGKNIQTEELIGYFNVSDEDTSDMKYISFLIGINDAHFDKLANITKNTMALILDDGITESDIQDNLDKIIKSKITNHLYGNDFGAVAFLIKSAIAPNLVIDEFATDVSRKNALDSVKPVVVTFKKGDRIVSMGQPVSKVQKDALKQCGYNVIQLNFSGIIGVFCLVFLALFICAYHIECYEPNLKRKSYYALISLLMLLLSFSASLLPPDNYYIYCLPLTAYVILLAIFLNPKTSFFATIPLLCAFSIALQLEVLFNVIFIFGAFATIFGIVSIDYSKRMELFKIGILTSGVYAICLSGAFLLDYNLDELNFMTYGTYLIAVLANGILSSIFALGLLPVFEAIFKISTPYTLIELANTNNPLLQKLQEKAPGTYHHSQMVSIIAGAAAESIGANAILTKIGALYHDVGKISRPLFFIENQSYYGVENPHEQFSPKFSKMVITTHPNEGVAIAKEYNISPIIYPFILEHHGDSIASYFYNEAIRQEGAENVSEADYRYNAPRPSSKETAIVMLADSVESAVRSLKNPSFEEIDAKISAIIRGKLLDDQLSDSPLTMKDLKTIAAVFNRVIKGMHHQRIKYHEDMEEIQNRLLNVENNDGN